MAAHRPFLRRRAPRVLAICAAMWLLALPLLAAVGFGSGPAVGAAAAGHSLCASGTMSDGTPPTHPQPGADCQSCLLCQQRGSAAFGLAVVPAETALIVPRETGADAPASAPAEPAERRAGRGGGSSRAPPALG